MAVKETIRILPNRIERSEKNPYGRTPEWPYGFHTDDTPRKTPIRLLSAFESLLYWVIVFAAPIYFIGSELRPFLFDGGTWFGYLLTIIAIGWVPFGILGNLIIRGVNKVFLKTDWRRPSKVKNQLIGPPRTRIKGYVPPTGENL